MDRAPEQFERKAPVPGLVSLAVPAFVEPGPKVGHRRQVEQKDPRRDAFWYRRTFRLEGPMPAVARLKVAKAMFGTRVFVNRQLVGDHMPCFTPGYFDVRSQLRPGENEVIIRVGADRAALPGDTVSGFDFEKDRYIPGIFDSVSLILSGTPHFLTLQTVPDITNRTVRIQAVLRNEGEARGARVSFVVREVKSGRIVGRETKDVAEIAPGAEQTVRASIPLNNCQLWSPENPFLYRLDADTGADSFTTRFGMRQFHFDPATHRAVLNGKPYFLRGSNFTLYRFFEDEECGTLPWDESWVRRLHQRVKDMNWNCLRYCIGFPPERWYEIADEEGILLQDEFPIWFGRNATEKKWPPALKTPHLAREYAEWMRERWNHPSVVIWDANNETASDQLAPAVAEIRPLDLSDRPWDNGYEYPARPGDVFESHPYHFNNPNFTLAELAQTSRIPRGNVQMNDGQHAVVINEYGWLWLNRDGTPTTLTSNLYVNLLGPNSTTAERRHLYARYLAADTEFWRCHRNAAAVLHFTTLGYARPDGQTSDHWLDVKKLTWEPEFYRYVKDAFEPVGLMLDFWSDKLAAGSGQEVPVLLINDLAAEWSGPVTLKLRRHGKTLETFQQDCRIKPYGEARLSFHLQTPQPFAQYTLQASLTGIHGNTVSSWRDFTILNPLEAGIALQRPARASSEYSPEHRASLAVDGLAGTYWSSDFSDPAWLEVDLGTVQTVDRVVVDWETAFAKAYSIALSTDGQNWRQVFSTSDGKGGLSEASFDPQPARWVKLTGTARGTKWGYGVKEFKVFSPDATPPRPGPAAHKSGA